jgi:hypothetical protein
MTNMNTYNLEQCSIRMYAKYSETSIHRFCRGREKETMDLGKQ